MKLAFRQQATLRAMHIWSMVIFMFGTEQPGKMLVASKVLLVLRVFKVK
jgi:hypothetical protein